MQAIWFKFLLWLMNFMSNLFILLLLIKFQINICGYLFILLLVNFIFYVEFFICFHMCLRFSFYLILLLYLELIFLLSIWVNLHIYIDIVFVDLVFGLKFLLIIFFLLYLADKISLFFWRKIKTATHVF